MAMDLTYMLNWNSIMWGPHIYSTWVSHTACYAGAYILSIVWGSHIYMPSVKVSMYILPHGINFLEVYVE